MKEKGINSEATKRINRLLVLRLLCTSPGLSRTELTRQTGLAKMTVTNIIADLMVHRMVRETKPVEKGKTGAGRKQMALRLSEEAPCVAGVWLSRDGCEGMVVTPELEELAHGAFRFHAEETADSILEKLTELCGTLIKKSGRRVAAIGISAIGPLNIPARIILNPPNFFGIRNFAVGERLSHRLALPVVLQNDMNAAALAEKYYGLGRDIRNFAYVGITNGIGAGVVLDDRLFEGTRGVAGELGHVIIDSHGILCHCGNRGCLETFVSVPRIMERFSQQFGRTFSGLEEICRFSEVDETGHSLMNRICGEFATGLVSFCNLFDPQMVLIGHEGASFGDDQLHFIEAEVNRRILGSAMGKISLIRSSFGRKAPIYGAAVTALKRIFDGDLLYDEMFSE